MPTSRCSEGFTLVEVMMAILVMTVGLLGLLQAVMVAYDARAKSARREQSYRLAEQELNNLALKPYDNISAVYQPYAAASPSMGTFTVRKDSAVIGNSKRIRVQVDWTMKGVPLHHEIYTMKTR